MWWCIWPPLFQCQQWSHSAVIHSSHLSTDLGLHRLYTSGTTPRPQGYQHMRERERVQQSASQPNLFDAIHHRGTLRNSGCRVTLHASRTQLTPLASGYCGPKLVLGLIFGSRTWHCWSLILGPEYQLCQSFFLCVPRSKGLLSPRLHKESRASFCNRGIKC